MKNGSSRAITTGILASVLALTAAGCVHQPRMVRAISQSRDQIKFLYTEGATQGILKCQVAADGALSNCRQMTVVFEK